MKTEQLIKGVAILLGENPAYMISPAESESPALADRILMEIEDCAAEVIRAAQKEELTGWRMLDGEGLETMEDGSALLPLPADFLMLSGLRLKGWEGSVTTIHTPGSSEAKMQSCPWSGLRGTSQRPVAVIQPSENGRCLRLYGSHTSPASIAEGWYMAAPHIDTDGNIELPASVVPRLLATIAGRIRKEC